MSRWLSTLGVSSLLSLLSSPIFAQGITPEEATSEQNANAQESFLIGDDAYDVQKYHLALMYFQESYEIVKSPNSRLMIARCLLELGRLDESYEEYTALMSEVQKHERYATTLAIAKKERSALLSRLAWLTIDLGSLPLNSRVEVGGRERSEGVKQEAIAVTPGKTLVLATAPDGREAHAVVHLAAGREATAQLRLGETVTVSASEPDDPAPEEDVTPEITERKASATAPVTVSSPVKTLTPWAYASLGVSVVGLSSFAILGTMSESQFSSLEEQCNAGDCPPGSQKDINKGQQLQTGANVSLAFGLLGAAGAIVLFTLEQKRNSSVNVGVGPGNMLVRGTF